MGRGKAKKDTVAVCLPKEERAFRAILVPEPHNNYDHNAIAVYSEAGEVGLCHEIDLPVVATPNGFR